MNKWRLGIYIAITAIVLSVIAIIYCSHVIDTVSNGKVYDNLESIPYNKTALLLGTSKYISKHTLNPYYTYRIQAALDLIHAHKTKYIIISGDNSTVSYNEPYRMRADLMKAGIDSSLIYLDFAGFRTFDSMIRLKEIFSQDSVTIISQKFHNQRAIYIASKEGIYAIGYNAKDVSTELGIKVQIREKLARVKVFIDYLFNKQPKFLGNKITIPQ